MTKWQWIASQLSRKLWIRTSLFAILALLSALVSIILKPYISADISALSGAEAVDSILHILASSMLAVTTFSLNIMVSAYSLATTSVTPRATKLVAQDTTTQNVLSTFIGSFLYSLVGIVAIKMGVYGEQGRVILFIVTLGVIILIVITLLRWIQHLSTLGRLADTCQRVEHAAKNALEQQAASPLYGANGWNGEADAIRADIAIYSDSIGYLLHIDFLRLSKLADACEAKVYINLLPGKFIYQSTPLLWIVMEQGKAPDLNISHWKEAFTVGENRTFEQDPRFGLSVLAEVASRALSPAVNDPGTAIDIIGRGIRLLTEWRNKLTEASYEVTHPRLFVVPLCKEDLFDDLFNPIARDGAALLEVQLRLQKGLCELAKTDEDFFRSVAEQHARLAWGYASAALTLEHEKATLKQVIDHFLLSKRV